VSRERIGKERRARIGEEGDERIGEIQGGGG
jgi:hypothetical protein